MEHKTSITIPLAHAAWQKNTRTWVLNINSVVPESVRLWIDGAEIVKTKFAYHNGKIELLDSGISVDENSVATAEFELTAFAQKSPRSQAVIIALIGIVPALLTFIGTLSFDSLFSEKQKLVHYDGHALVSYSDYPVSITKDLDSIFLDKRKLINCISILLDSDDPKAAADLVYLVQRNQGRISFSEQEAEKYKKLISKYGITDYRDTDSYRKSVFDTSIQTIDALGEMFPKIEFVLHDARDPLNSVVRIRNNITDRKEGSPATYLGIELIKKYQQSSLGTSPLVSYLINFNDKQTNTIRRFKSATIPLYDSRLGLFGFICVNVDATNLDDPRSPEAMSFLQSMARIEKGELKEILRR